MKYLEEDENDFYLAFLSDCVALKEIPVNDLRYQALVEKLQALYFNKDAPMLLMVLQKDISSLKTDNKLFNEIYDDIYKKVAAKWTDFIKSKMYEMLQFKLKEMKVFIKHFDEVFDDSLKKRHFQRFADDEYAGESQLFLTEVVKFKRETNPDKKKELYDSIWKNFISEESKVPVNISEETLKIVTQMYQKGDFGAYERPEQEIGTIVRDMYNRFKASAQFDVFVFEKFNPDVSNTLLQQAKTEDRKVTRSLFSKLSGLFNKKPKKPLSRAGSISESDKSPNDTPRASRKNSSEVLSARTTMQSIVEEFRKEEKRKAAEKERLARQRVLQFNYDESNPHQRVFRAIETDQMEVIEKEFAENEIDLNFRFANEQYTYLHFAVLFNREKMVDFFVQKGIPVDSLDKEKRTPLLMACSDGVRNITIFLLGNGAKVTHRDNYGWNALILALKKHHFHIVEDLILFGADINFKRENGATVLHECIKEGDEVLYDKIKGFKIKWNLRDQYGQTALLKGAEKAGYKFLYNYMNQDGVDVTLGDDNGRNVFHYLAKYGRSDFFEYLATLDKKDLAKWIPMLQVKEKVNQFTPLHMSVDSEKVQCVKSITTLLLSLDVDVNPKDKDQQTPYQLAVRKAEKLYKDFVLSEKNVTLHELENKVQEAIDIKNFLAQVTKVKK